MNDSPLTLTIPVDRRGVPSEDGHKGHCYESREGYVYLCVQVEGEDRPMYVCLGATSIFRPVPLAGYRLRDLGKMAILREEE